MNEVTLDIDELAADSYLASVEYPDGTTSVRLDLTGVAEQSKGRLEADKPTARATIRYLLNLQDARELPERVEIADVLAAYADAVDAIVQRRDHAQG